MTELDDAKKLPPEERIRKLKELEEHRKNEIEEAESLIRDSMREITETSTKVPVKQIRAGDISQLTTAEEKRVFKTARFQDSEGVQESQPTQQGQGQTAKEQSLEEMAEEAKKQEGSKKPIYGQALEEARKGLDYSAKMTTTGVETRGGEGVEEIYRGSTVTGEEQGQKSMYERQNVEERTAGMYARKEKKKDDWAI